MAQIRRRGDIRKMPPQPPKYDAEKSSSLKAQVILGFATAAGLTTQREITRAVGGVRAETLHRWMRGESAPPKPKLLNMAGLLVSDNPRPLLDRFKRDSEFATRETCERKAWLWAVGEIAKMGEATEGSAIRLLGAERGSGMFTNGSPDAALLWRTLEMAIWTSEGIRLSNFARLDWTYRWARPRETARPQISFSWKFGWLDVLKPFDLIGRAPTVPAWARIAVQTNDGVDIPQAYGRRRRSA